MNILYSLTFLISAALSAAASPPQAVNAQTINDKVSVKLGEEFAIEFKRDGERLLQPSISKETDAKKAAVKIKLAVTTASPRRTNGFGSVGGDWALATALASAIRANVSKATWPRKKTRAVMTIGASVRMQSGWNSGRIRG